MGKTYRHEAASLFVADEPRYEPSANQHPPYSVLDAAGGWWQKRRGYWQSLGITDAGDRPTVIRRGASSASVTSGNEEAVAATSQFSPVLTELLVAYYSRPGDAVFDPFCGGPIRGVVATMMGRDYEGLDLSADQVEANREAFDLPIWRVADARRAGPTRAPALVLTCPPYHDLERYSDDPADLSVMDWTGFVGAHQEVLRRSVGGMAEGFAAWVVGDFRDGSGGLRGFPGLVATQMEAAGLTIWNRHVVRHPLVTAQMRWKRSWEVSRKATTTHAEVIVGRV